MAYPLKIPLHQPMGQGYYGSPATSICIAHIHHAYLGGCLYLCVVGDSSKLSTSHLQYINVSFVTGFIQGTTLQQSNKKFAKI